MKKWFLVQAILRTTYGQSRTSHRIVTAVDPIDAARQCFEALPVGYKVPKTKFPEYFKVYPERDRETFMDEVGALKVADDMNEDTPTPYDAVCDMFEAKPVEVRL